MRPPAEADPKTDEALVLVQCTLCGRMETLDGLWAEAFLARSLFACMLTEGCSGFVVIRHDLCSPNTHHVARRLKRPPRRNAD